MNWVSPIKDEETLNNLLDALREYDEKYYVLFRVGMGTGLQLQSILEIKVGEIRGKDEFETFIGAKNLRRIFQIPLELKGIITDYTRGRSADDYLIPDRSAGKPLTREQAYRVFKTVSDGLGLTMVGAESMRKTFAWRYYHTTGDIYYLQHLFNHSSPIATFRFIGEKPKLVTHLAKMANKENVRARKAIFKDNAGVTRIQGLRDFLNYLEDGIKSPEKEDRYFGAVDCFLTEAEELVKEFMEEMDD